MFYLVNNLKLTANAIIFKAVIEGITISFIISLASVKLMLKRKDIMQIIKIAIIVTITLLLRYALDIGFAQFAP